MNVVKSVEAERNALAHGHFGISNLLPKDLVWLETVHYVAHKTNVELRGQVEWNEEKHESMVKNFFVYTKVDLEKIEEDMRFASRYLQLFMKYLGNKSLVVRDHLCKLSHVAHELKRLRKHPDIRGPE
jgi:hypothetical protein